MTTFNKQNTNSLDVQQEASSPSPTWIVGLPPLEQAEEYNNKWQQIPSFEVELNNGNKIPRVGLGTWQSQGKDCFEAVKCALEAGYRHIDSAVIYRNEVECGKAIKASKLPREQIFITSKLPPTLQGYNECIMTVQQSLKDLDTPYIDLYLIHWPGASKEKLFSPKNAAKRKESWQALEKLYREGLVKNIGVSNYYENHLQDLFSYCTILPQVNQIEYHPYLKLEGVEKLCASKNIRIEAYSSLGSGHLLKEPELQTFAKEFSKRVGKQVELSQILLQWAVQNEAIILPKSVHKERVINNFKCIYDKDSYVSLSYKDMEYLNSFHKKVHYCWDPTLIH